MGVELPELCAFAATGIGKKDGLSNAFPCLEIASLSLLSIVNVHYPYFDYSLLNIGKGAIAPKLDIKLIALRSRRSLKTGILFLI